MPLERPDSFVIEDWQSPTLLNGWVNVVQGTVYGGQTRGAVFRKDPLGIIRLAGRIAGGAADQPAFTLPAGYRPKNAFRILVARSDQTVLGFCAPFVMEDGRVIITAVASNWVHLDGIIFSTD